MNRSRMAALALGAALSSGCYGYIPVELEAVPPGEQVLVHLTRQGLADIPELPNLSVENMAVIGIRGTINVRDWWDAVRERGIPAYAMSQLRRQGVEETVGGVLDRVWDGVDGVGVATACPNRLPAKQNDVASVARRNANEAEFMG